MRRRTSLLAAGCLLAAGLAGCAQTQPALTEEQGAALRQTCADVGTVEQGDDVRPAEGISALLQKVEAPRRRVSEANVDVGLRVSPDGQAFDVHALQTRGPESSEFVASVIEAVRETRFEPAQKDGATVCARGTVSISITTERVRR